MSPTTTRSLPAISVVMVLLVAGCATGIVGDPDPEEIGALAEAAHEDIDSYNATVTTYTDGEKQSVEKVVEKPHDGKYYRETLEGEFLSEGTITVANGSTTWTYDPETETAQRFEQPQSAQKIDYGEMVEEMIETSDVSFDGTDTVDDRHAYVVTLVPTDEQMQGETTVWIDAKTYFPVKYEYRYEFDGETSQIVVEYTDLEFDVDPDPDLFEFDPPAGTDIEHVEIPEHETYDTIEAAEEAVGFDAPTPDLPGDHEVDLVTATFEDDPENVTLSVTYTDGEEPITVAKATSEASHHPEDTEPVSVGDREATYAEVGDYGTLTWDCDEYEYRLSGAYDREALVDAAASIEC